MDTIDHQQLAGESALLQAPKQLDQPGDIAVGSQPDVVIIGAGFAGLSVAKAISTPHQAMNNQMPMVAWRAGMDKIEAAQRAVDMPLRLTRKQWPNCSATTQRTSLRWSQENVGSPANCASVLVNG